MKQKLDRAAGGIVFRQAGASLEVVLIATEKYGRPPRWSLPKGHYKKQETAEQAACREVTEETGLEVRVVAPLGDVDYWFVEGGVRYHKYVTYFALAALGGNLEDHDDEVVEARWFEVNEALGVLAYPNERQLLKSSLTALRAAAGQDA
jgi:8-oxo-dGTP pyrophosphatase MutT (NUDIX family)